MVLFYSITQKNKEGPFAENKTTWNICPSSKKVNSWPQKDAFSESKTLVLSALQRFSCPKEGMLYQQWIYCNLYSQFAWTLAESLIATLNRMLGVMEVAMHHSCSSCYPYYFQGFQMIQGSKQNINEVTNESSLSCMSFVTSWLIS